MSLCVSQFLYTAVLRLLKLILNVQTALPSKLVNRMPNFERGLSYVDPMYIGLCGAYARANALGLAPCLALRAIIHKEFGEPWDLVRSGGREAWYAAGQASGHPPR